MNDYFEQVDLILQNKIDKMPSQRNTAAKFYTYMSVYEQCGIEMQDELRTLFNNFTESYNLSEKEVYELNDYNKKSYSVFESKFKVW